MDNTSILHNPLDFRSSFIHIYVVPSLLGWSIMATTKDRKRDEGSVCRISIIVILVIVFVNVINGC